MGFKSLFKGWMFSNSYNLAKSNLDKIGLMALFDASFIVSFFYLLPYLARYIGENYIFPIGLLGPSVQALSIFIMFTVSYYLIILFFYSFFKYCVMDTIRSVYKKSEFSFSRLGKFFLLNLALILPPYVLFSFTVGSIKESFRPYGFLAIGIPLLLYVYALLNSAHSFFYRGSSFKESLKKSLEASFKIKAYKETVLIIIIAGLALGIFFWLMGMLINWLLSGNYLIYLNAYPYYRVATVWLSYAVIYAIVLVNRITFYKMAK